MAKRKPAKPETDVELNMTPMIDVTFQLLIFFIVTLKFKTLEKKLLSYLPTDFGTAARPQLVEENFMTVKLKQPRKEEDPRRIVFRTTRYFIERDRIEGTSDNEIYAQIHERLKEFRTITADAKGKIEAGPGVPHHRVVSVLDIFRRAGYETITFVGLAPNAQITNKWFKKITDRLKN